MSGVLSLCVAMLATAAQLSIVTPQNLLTNSGAEYGLDSWLVEGDVTVGRVQWNRCFVVRKRRSAYAKKSSLPRSTTFGLSWSSWAMVHSRVDLPIPGSPIDRYLYGLNENSRRSSDSWVQQARKTSASPNTTKPPMNCPHTMGRFFSKGCPPAATSRVPLFPEMFARLTPLEFPAQTGVPSRAFGTTVGPLVFCPSQPQ